MTSRFGTCTIEYAVGIERWCDAVRTVDPRHAAATTVVPLTVADGLALLRQHDLARCSFPFSFFCCIENSQFNVLT
jgi:hypothetical protein